MADFCSSCEESGMPGASDFAGWLAGRAGYGWGLCEGCGSHLFDDAGRAACDGDGGPLLTALTEACPSCVFVAGALTVITPELRPARWPRPPHGGGYRITGDPWAELPGSLLPTVTEVHGWVAERINSGEGCAVRAALVLAEEAGEACRAEAKRGDGIRGTREEWTVALRTELGDVALACLNVAGHLGEALAMPIYGWLVDWPAPRPTAHLLAELARWSGATADFMARREEEGIVRTRCLLDFYGEHAGRALVEVFALAARVAYAEGWALDQVAADRWREITARDPRARRAPEGDDTAGSSGSTGRRGLCAVVAGTTSAALLAAGLVLGVGSATAAPALAPSRGDSSAALATIDGGSYRHVYRDGYRSEWLDVGDDVEASVTLAEAGEVIEVRGAGATCTITAPDGTVIDRERAGVLRHARCGGA